MWSKWVRFRTSLQEKALGRWWSPSTPLFYFAGLGTFYTDKGKFVSSADIGLFHSLRSSYRKTICHTILPSAGRHYFPAFIHLRKRSRGFSQRYTLRCIPLARRVLQTL